MNTFSKLAVLFLTTAWPGKAADTKPHPEDERWIATTSIAAYRCTMLKRNEATDHP
jgi:hypothetical protein